MGPVGALLIHRHRGRYAHSKYAMGISSSDNLHLLEQIYTGRVYATTLNISYLAKLFNSHMEGILQWGAEVSLHNCDL